LLSNSACTATPRVLVLHLKRFQWGATGRPGRKIDASVDIPAEISLGSFLTEDAAAGAGGGAGGGGGAGYGGSRGGGADSGTGTGTGVGPKYRLFAVTNHMGSLHGGHYTATVGAYHYAYNVHDRPQRF
jgi:ubiquitin C-terminal hydrolase